MQEMVHVPVPHGAIVSVKPGCLPELFQQPNSHATEDELEAFLDAITRMRQSKRAA